LKAYSQGYARQVARNHKTNHSAEIIHSLGSEASNDWGGERNWYPNWGMRKNHAGT